MCCTLSEINRLFKATNQRALPPTPLISIFPIQTFANSCDCRQSFPNSELKCAERKRKFSVSQKKKKKKKNETFRLRTGSSEKGRIFVVWPARKLLSRWISFLSSRSQKKKNTICIYDLTASLIITGTNIFKEYKTSKLAERSRPLRGAVALRELFTASKYFAKPRHECTEEIGCHLENAYPTILIPPLHAQRETFVRPFDPRSASRSSREYREIRLLSRRVISASSFPSKRRDFTTSETLPISSIYSLFVLSCLFSLLPSRCPAFPPNGDLN